jgi:adenylate kinase
VPHKAGYWPRIFKYSPRIACFMKVICVTGTPAAGKTAIAKKLALRYNLYYLDANRIVNQCKLSSGYDRKRKAKIVDTNRLGRKLIGIIGFFKKCGHIGNALMPKAGSAVKLKNNAIKKKYRGIVIDSHLSHYLPEKYVNLVVVAKCGIKKLCKRLEKRKYSQAKIRENIQAEIFDICRNEALERGHNIIVLDTTKGFDIIDVKI